MRKAWLEQPTGMSTEEFLRAIVGDLTRDLAFLAEGAEVLMLDVLASDDEDPNALEMRHRLHLLGFTQTDLIDGQMTDSSEERTDG